MSKRITKYLCLFLTFVTVWSIGFQALAVNAFNKNNANKIAAQLTPTELKAKAFASVHFATGEVVFESPTAKDHFSVGNLIKLMTLYLAFEAIENGTTSLDGVVSVSKNAQKASEGRERVFLDAGKKEKITVEEAVIAICVGSACDAAYALAEHVANGTEAKFVDMMNAKAKELGMNDTNFVDSTGNAIIDQGQYSCAHDLALLSYHFAKNFPDALKYTKLTYGSFKHTSTGQPDTEMVSSNKLVSSEMFPEVDGGLLVGYSKADKYAQAATAKIGEERVAGVVIGEDTAELRAGELKYLLQYTASNFEVALGDPVGTYVRKVTVKDGESLKVKTVIGGEFSYLQNMSEDYTLESKIVLDEALHAPVEKGSVVGKIVYLKVTTAEDGSEIKEELGSVPLVTDEYIEKANWFVLFIRKILTWLGIGDY